MEEAQEAPLRKRVRRRVLDYIAANYLFIIKILTAVVILLVFSFIILYFCKHRCINCHEISTPSPSPVRTVTTITVETKHLSSATEEYITSESPQSTNMADYYPGSISCKRVKCDGFIPKCNITEVNYYNTKVYSCCSCLPADLTLRRFESLRMAKTTTWILRATYTPNLSDLDLQLKEQLPYLSGNWDVSIESDTVQDLAYKDVRIADQQH